VNRVAWIIDGSIEGAPFIVEIYNSAGVIRKRVSYSGMLVNAEWQSIIMVFNGVFVSLYHNGLLVPGVVQASNAGSLSDTSRFVEIGGSSSVLASPAGLKFNGLISHVGIWSSQLSANAVTAIATRRNALDLRYNRLDYQAAEALQHYYKLGEDVLAYGRDFTDTLKGTGTLSMTTVAGTPILAGSAPD
jgi:hypothetical protein